MRIVERIEIKLLSGINWRCKTIEEDDVIIHIYFEEAPEKPEYFTSDYKILEESKSQNWGKGLSVRFDRSNYGLSTSSRDHLHIYKKKNQLFAINRDGSAHDSSGPYQIPRTIADKIRQEYPDFNVPDNNLIESIESENGDVNEEILYLLSLQ